MKKRFSKRKKTWESLSCDDFPRWSLMLHLGGSENTDPTWGEKCRPKDRVTLLKTSWFRRIIYGVSNCSMFRKVWQNEWFDSLKQVGDSETLQKPSIPAVENVMTDNHNESSFFGLFTAPTAILRNLHQCFWCQHQAQLSRETQRVYGRPNSKAHSRKFIHRTREVVASCCRKRVFGFCFEE